MQSEKSEPAREREVPIELKTTAAATTEAAEQCNQKQNRQQSKLSRGEDR